MFKTRTLIPLEAATIALFAVAATWLMAAPGTVPEWEQETFRAINRLPDWLFPVVWGPMQLGAIVGALIVALLLFLFRHRSPAATFAMTVAVGWLIAQGVKTIVARDRPLGAGLDTIIRGVDMSGFGFVSGHTTVAFAGATVIWVCFGRRWGAFAYGLAAVVGFARIYVGAHLPLDVIGGAATGTLVAGTITWVEQRAWRWRNISLPADP